MSADKLVELIKKMEIERGLIDLKLAEINEVSAELQVIRCRLAELEGMAEMDNFLRDRSAQ